MKSSRSCLAQGALLSALLMALGHSAGARTTATTPTVAFTAATFSALPSAGAVTITVTRSGDTNSSVLATYTTIDGTAVAGNDYASTTGTLAWASGDGTPKSFVVPIASADPGNNSFTVALLSTSGANFGAPFDATVSISSAMSSGSNSPSFYVAPTGNDSNAGSLSAPFLTLKKAQSAMKGSSTKTTYLRAGTYTVTSTLALSSADDGERWQYYPPDGVDSAVLNGNNSVSGGLIAIEGGSNITINGLKLENFVDYGILGGGGQNTNWGAVAEDTGNTIENCDIGFNTITSWHSAGISLSGPNATIANNYIHDIGSQGIASYAYYAGQSINGTVIKNNVVLRAVQRMSDGGAIYTNMHSGIQSDYVTIINNYVADQGSANTWGVHGIYLDDLSSNVTVTGNVVRAPSVGTGTGSGSRYGTNAISAFLDNSGNKNVISGNIVDLGSSATVSTVVFYYDSAEPVDVGMEDDTFTGNIVISNFTGGLKTNVSGVSRYAYFAYTPALGADPKGFSYTIQNNAYWNYAAGGPVSSNGTVASDSSPITEDPQLSGWTYEIASGSPVYNSPVNFAPIVGGWGPTGYVIPESGVAPSSPH